MKSKEELYNRRIQSYQYKFNKIEKQTSKLSIIRLILFAIFWTLVYLTTLYNKADYYLLLPFMLALLFIKIVILHNKLTKAQSKLEIAIRLCKRSISKINNTWFSEKDFYNYSLNENEEKLYQKKAGVLDLDLFGNYSLYHFIDYTGSHKGDSLLKKEILKILDPDFLNDLQKKNAAQNIANSIKKRQSAVQELKQKRAFTLAFQSAGIPYSLLKKKEFNEKKPGLFLNNKENDSNESLYQKSVLNKILIYFARLTILASSLSFITQYIIGIHAYFNIFFTWQVLLYLLYAFGPFIRPDIKKTSFSFLPILIDQIEIFTKIKFESEELQSNSNLLKDSELPLKSLKKIYTGLSLRDYGLWWLILNLLFFTDLHYQQKWEKWQGRYLNKIQSWLDALAKADLLVSLAVFSYDHDKWIFPEALKTNYKLNVKNLKHPLLAETQAIGNDLHLNKKGTVVILTGSNMSGKSTFLRTLGSNLILANMGAVVNAEHFQFSPFQLFCVMRAGDSIQEGISLFYQEVLRLKDLLDLSKKKIPFLYLIDEMLRGTNTRERLIASESLVHRLFQTTSLGLLSTHDISLSKIKQKNNLLLNYHFCETVKENKMHFDYLLHPGPLKNSNALKLLELSGIDLDFRRKKTHAKK